jgi:hypothetical protein
MNSIDTSNVNCPQCSLSIPKKSYYFLSLSIFIITCLNVIVFAVWLQSNYNFFQGVSGDKGGLKLTSTVTVQGKTVTLKRCNLWTSGAILLILSFIVLSAGFAAWLPVCDSTKELKTRKYWLIAPFAASIFTLVLCVVQSYIKKGTIYGSLLTILSTLIVTLCSLGFLIA